MEQPWTFLSCPFAQLCFSLDKHLPQELIIDTGQAQIIKITALPLSSEIYCLRQATLRSLSFGMEEGSTGGLGASFVPLGALSPLRAQGSL